MQLVRSLIFNASIYLMMLIYALVFFIPALLSRDWARRACHAWCVFVIWAARWMIGLRTEVRGTPPTGEVMVAAKHQSFFDIVVIFHAVPRAKFIMKRELMYAPILGQYALRIGCVPVDRGKRGAAVAKMKEAVSKGAADPGQLVIYPQGTRVAPDAKRPYKVGTGALYQQLGQPCVPVATNIGHFWPKRGFLRRPGLAVVEFLDPIEPGMEIKAFMERLETAIESHSDALLREARGQV
ncbi:MAG: 1-acyl-sn-glycerol-3-phosphate acyltransferase [Silicimonas sp.]|nr:1-acyl-sn-glycerol-3-phosphate acyltransferase [Silicimonas sp.]NND19762.1 1-acyl-sn-glycerol-3-phosphate acyltransferase [Silicimonas sp.]NND22994.1 1-acyl-sn-glycerol-3-phosphate acyltransferase [Silicimonas sp.]NND41286.1 1-acyl-sn-glycerol-3-phosphate acyltransferase [Silicimonas sp.]RZW03238.1 MAG: 1-acyl-sn-glycerol-3-phosphate acyltransferase [Paracoccaceae bacterium]